MFFETLSIWVTFTFYLSGEAFHLEKNNFALINIFSSYKYSRITLIEFQNALWIFSFKRRSVNSNKILLIKAFRFLFSDSFVQLSDQSVITFQESSFHFKNVLDCSTFVVICSTSSVRDSPPWKLQGCFLRPLFEESVPGVWRRWKC